MAEMRSNRWICPRCETLNRGDYCTLCGEPRKKDERKPVSGALLPEEEILRQAHRVAITRSNQTVPFFILTLLLCSVIGYVFGLIFGMIFAILFPFSVLFVQSLFNIFLGNIFEYGEHIAGLRLYRDQNISIGTLFEGMHDYGRILPGMFWFKLRRGLWSLVPIVGITKRYSYMFTPYILCESPDLSPEEALQESVRLTQGHKLELFVRDLRFTGWRVLNLLSLGAAGIAYYFAYSDATWAGYYDAARKTSGRRMLPVTPKGGHHPEDDPIRKLPNNGFRPVDPL